LFVKDIELQGDYVNITISWLTFDCEERPLITTW
jgi:hypothetical protein